MKNTYRFLAGVILVGEHFQETEFAWTKYAKSHWRGAERGVPTQASALTPEPNCALHRNGSQFLANRLCTRCSEPPLELRLRRTP
ncbi:hypothetical protein [Caballeronia grimmiae]|uniref:Uncharacterized protein n=1 Tax=Caballeronia grimmiae TaxID=1071679 RepID=A0ABQ1S9N0_9BURK|nr:hypothetical protein [Caballeronia grimmiae]GGD96949.1 hypothetical protein GCM10010985_59600 [Caballeronia grimmiae]